MLSELTGSPIDQAAAFGIQDAGKQQQVPIQNAAPATPDGSAPAALPVANPLNPEGGKDASDALAAFAIKRDTDGKVITDPNQAPAPQQLVMPKLEDFATVAEGLAGQVTIDAELATAAVGGDAEALTKLLTTTIQQTIQRTVNASANVSQQIGANQVSIAEQSAAGKIQSSQAEQTATATAIQANAELSTGLQAKLLVTTIQDLREQFPTAPAELIGKQAAHLLTQNAPAPVDNATPVMNWEGQF